LVDDEDLLVLIGYSKLSEKRRFSDAHARAVSGSQLPGEFLAGYLVNDMQGSVNRAREVLAYLGAVQSLREAEWTQSGNAYVITAKGNDVVFDLHWADEGQADTAEVSLNAVREALKAWLVALEARSVTIWLVCLVRQGG
jgi:hypothetical protein